MTELDHTIEALNHKGYCQSSLSATDNSSLSSDEAKLITTFRPERVFVVYGSLAPGRPNHQRLEHIPGRWLQGTIKGKLVKQGWGADLGYYGLQKFAQFDDRDIAAFIFYSDHLLRYWTELDEFEGQDYERKLIKFHLETNELGVGNIYALKDL